MQMSADRVQAVVGVRRRAAQGKRPKGILCAARTVREEPERCGVSIEPEVNIN